MRALVKETMSREHVDTLARDIEEACATWPARAVPTSPSVPRSSPARATDRPRSIRIRPPRPTHHRRSHDMGCLFAIFAGIFPRLGLLIIWIARPARVGPPSTRGSGAARPDLPALRHADLRHPLAGRWPEWLGLVLGRHRCTVRHRSLGRERGAAPLLHRHHHPLGWMRMRAWDVDWCAPGWGSAARADGSRRLGSASMWARCRTLSSTWARVQTCIVTHGE